MGTYPCLNRTMNFCIVQKKLNVFLKSTDDPKVLLSRIDEILKSEELIGYSFNSLFELLKRFKSDIKTFSKIQDKLRESPLLKKFLMRKLASSELGIIRKIEYYSFVKDLLGMGSRSIENAIRSNFYKIASQPIKELTRETYAQFDFIRTLISALAKHNLIDATHLEKVIFSENTSPIVKAISIRSIGAVKDFNGNAERIINKILDDPRLDIKGISYYISSPLWVKEY